MAADTGAPITALATSPDDLLCVVAGRDLLKLYSLVRDGNALLERKNLRAGRKKTLDLSTSDVRWHPTHSNIIATASTTGAVLLWDLSKPKGGAGDAAFRHERTVNRITWHPSESSWLLSCSQDATVRLWDARCPPASEDGATGGGAAAVFCYRYAEGVSRRLAALQPGGSLWRSSASVAVRDVQARRGGRIRNKRDKHAAPPPSPSSCRAVPAVSSLLLRCRRRRRDVRAL